MKHKKTILYADGIHDDADALQKWGDGEQVYYPNGEKVTRLIERKLLFLGKQVVVNKNVRGELKSCVFLNKPATAKDYENIKAEYPVFAI